MLKRWFDLFFWWLPGEQAKERPSGATRQDAGRVPEQAPAAARQAGDVDHEAGLAKGHLADDLTVLKGIGPVVQEKLRSLGIRTFGDLAAADPEALAEQLKGRQPISRARVRGWTEAARQRTAARG